MAETGGARTGQTGALAEEYDRAAETPNAFPEGNAPLTGRQLFAHAFALEFSRIRRRSEQIGAGLSQPEG